MRRTGFPTRLAWLALALGCGGPDGSAPEPAGREPSVDHVVRDSAGIRIVESHAPAEPGGWAVEHAPLYALGDAPSDPDRQFHRVLRAWALSDGTVVVSEASGPLRWFTDMGTRVATVGTFGEGPCDLMEVGGGFVTPGDTLVVHDRRLRRLTYFAPDGGCTRTEPFAPDVPVRSVPIARFADGSLLLAALGGDAGARGPSRLERPPKPTWRYFPEAGMIEPLVVLRGMEVAVVTPPITFHPATWPDGAPMMMNFMLSPLARDTRIAAGPGGWVAADSERWEIEYRTPDGAVRTLGRKAVSARPLTRATVDAYVAGHEPSVRGMVEAFLREVPDVPATLPAHAEVLLDPLDHVWVREHVPPGEEGSDWSVFGPDGVWLATIPAPPRLRVLAVAVDRVVGVTRDELGVEVVSVHRLRRP